jgi:hypothetical protein
MSAADSDEDQTKNMGTHKISHKKEKGEILDLF